MVSRPIATLPVGLHLRRSSASISIIKVLVLVLEGQTSPGWLQLVFHFGIENREEQLKKAPCRFTRQICHWKGLDDS